MALGATAAAADSAAGTAGLAAAGTVDRAARVAEHSAASLSGALSLRVREGAMKPRGGEKMDTRVGTLFGGSLLPALFSVDHGKSPSQSSQSEPNRQMP